MKVLLVQPPFWAVNSPSIGLSYLRGALHDAHVEVDILYSNLDFARLIGREVYGLIQSQLPVDLLFGDLVFGPALQETPVRPGQMRAFLETLLTSRTIALSVPEALLAQCDSLAEATLNFVGAFQASRPWQGYDLVGFTTTFSLVPALAMARAMKQDPGAPPIVFGGCHCDGSLGEAMLRHFPWIDFVARGDGEKLLVSLVEHLDSGQMPLVTVDGLLWREGDRVCAADQSRARAADLDALPEPVFTDWLERMETLGWKDLSTLRLPIETSRGCWYGQKQQCTFCGLNGASMEFRSKGVDRILREYVSLLDYGIPVVYAVDSVLDPRFFQEVIPRIEALPRKATMFFEVRATHSRAQLLALRKAGIRVLQPGIESLNTHLLNLMNKGTTAFQNVRLLRWAAELKLPLSWNMLCGLPGETAADYRSMAKLVPALVHLMPPASDCNPVHVDRFSPLFEQLRGSIQPIAPYGLALGLVPEAISELAYHFQFDASQPAAPEVSEAIQQLRTAIVAWQSKTGFVAFVQTERAGSIQLFDTRFNVSIDEQHLEGVRARAYAMMHNGCSRELLATELGLSSTGLEELLSEFLERSWIVELDAKYLSLAVPVDEDLAEGIPNELQGNVAIALYQHRLSQLWEVVKWG